MYATRFRICQVYGALLMKATGGLFNFQVMVATSSGTCMWDSCGHDLCGVEGSRSPFS